MKIQIFANDYHLVSGGDVIFAEMAKTWSKSQEVEIITNEKGKIFCDRRRLNKVKITVWRSSVADQFGIVLAEAYKTILSAIGSLWLKNKVDVIFSSSLFWPDIFSGVITKIKYPKAKLVVGLYLLFPSPFDKVRYDGGFLKSIFLSLSQSVSLILVDRFADIVLTASRHRSELLHNNRQLNSDTVVAIRGGVDIKNIVRIKRQKKKFDCVYFGRFHSQKGIFELLEVWSEILRIRPGTKFLLAGGGPLEQEIIEKAKNLGIIDAITFSGLITGSHKYRLLKSAKVFTSASRLDTGNIALDEVLACSVPGVVYDIPHLHYDSGVIKIPVGSRDRMVGEVLRLLANPIARNKLGRKGKDFIRMFDWSRVSRKVLSLFQNQIKI